MTDPARRNTEVLRARLNEPLVDPAGRPLARPVVEDRTITYAKDGESYSIDPEQLLMRAARMQRDGMSLAAIRAELDLKGVSYRQLQRALYVGHDLLAAAIREGREPAESKNVVGYEVIDEQGNPVKDEAGDTIVIEANDGA